MSTQKKSWDELFARLETALKDALQADRSYEPAALHLNPLPAVGWIVGRPSDMSGDPDAGVSEGQTPGGAA